MSTQTLSFVVLGKPQPKGAHTSFVPTRRDGSLVTRFDGRPVVVTKDTNDRLEAAQRDVKIVALAARGAVGEAMWHGPVAVDISYFFKRKKGDYGTGRNAGLLKDSAPTYPLTAADIDKLELEVSVTRIEDETVGPQLADSQLALVA